MNYIFLDTNVFLHFKNFEDIDWSETINTEQKSICIVIPFIVIDELDKHKYNLNPKISGRIRKLMPKLHKILEENSIKGWNVEFGKRPSKETIENLNLDKSQIDDCIIASIFEFKKNISINDSIYYATNDFGPKIKCKSLNINIIELSEKYLLNQVSSEEQALRKEIDNLKNLQPKLSLNFNANNDNLIEITQPKELDINKHLLIISQIEKLKSEYPKIESIQQNNFFSLSSEQIKRYNNELETFFQDCDNYYDTLFESYNYDLNLLKIELALNNFGNIPANDIDIELDFPDNFIVFENKELDKYYLEKPEPPIKPSNPFDVSGILNPYYSKKSNIVKSKSKGKSNFEIHYNNLKHNQKIVLDKLYIHFDKLELKNFQIKYRIMVSNIPNLIEGILVLKVN